MPYKIVHRCCKQSDGDAGEWAVVRRDIGKQVSCHSLEARLRAQSPRGTLTKKILITLSRPFYGAS